MQPGQMYHSLLLLYYITLLQIRKPLLTRITPLQACIRTTEKQDHSVEDDLFDLGLGFQMGYFWVVRWNRTPDY
ncbi:hypothetical protein U3516DRAFT_733743 [Neocallimastix sp. 'constans']